jgi:predicted RNA-binding Zn ribbon-like protein
MDRKLQSDPLAASSAARLGLIAGRLCLDFANTASGRGGPKQLDHLRRYEDLAAWAVHAGAIERPAALELLRQAEAAPDAAAALLVRALALRELCHRLAMTLAAGGQPAPADLAGAAAAWRSALATATLAPAGARFDWRWPADDLGAGWLLGPLALDLIALLIGPDLARLKRCPGADCGWVFLDRSRNGRRRWCEMRICGNRAKARRHHERRLRP